MLKILKFLTVLLCIFYQSVFGGEVNYQDEFNIAYSGNASFYENNPSLQPYENDEELENIKIILPNDLNRILKEYKENGKPISLAVACGNRELPFRSTFAAKSNDPSKPSDDDYWDHMEEPINATHNKENFISLDLYLGANKHVDRHRGAGHILMDVQNIKHWKQLKNFLESENVKIHQIIFTAIIDPEFIFLSPTIDEEWRDVLFSMLEDGGKLVSPYFRYNPIGYHIEKFKPFHFIKTSIKNSHFSWLFNGYNNKIFGTDLKLISENKINTNVPSMDAFLQPSHNYEQKKISKEGLYKKVNALIQHNESSKEWSAPYKNFIKNYTFLAITEFKLSDITNNNSQQLSSYIFNDSSPVEIQEKLYSLYLNYFNEIGLKATFITSPQNAELLNIPHIKGQNDWTPGDYPYGERDHIALVIEH